MGGIRGTPYGNSGDTIRITAASLLRYRVQGYMDGVPDTVVGILAFDYTQRG